MARRTPLALLALTLSVGTGCMRARGTPDEPVVAKLEINGAKALEPASIKKKLATQPAGTFAWDEAPRLDPDALSADRRRVEAYYRANGYYEARVTDVHVDPDGKGRVKIVFDVTEGAPVKVTKLELAGLDDLPEAREKVGKLPLAPGDPFVEGLYDATKAQVLKALRNAGWANADVTQEAHVYPGEHAAEVRYVVKPGQRFRFGPIFVAGTAQIPRDRIREQALAAVKPGEWYADDALAKAQTRVFDLGVFGGVRVTRGTPDEKRGFIPIVVAVREAPFRTIRAGPGVGIEANTRWDVHAMAGWTNRNFYGDLRRLQLDLRAGYAWLLGQVNKRGAVALASTEFSQPGAISRNIDVATRIELERGLEQGYDFWSERFRLAFPLRFDRRLILVPSYNLEVYQLQNIEANFNPNEPTTEGPQLQNCNGSVCLLSYLEQRIGWDARNDPVNTKHGYFVQIAFQEGFKLGGFGYQYVRIVPELRAFFGIREGMVLATRARVGALIPVSESGNPPIVALFMAGGSASMRGYYTNRLSPMSLDTKTEDWIAVGGNGIADGSIELRFDISGPIGGAAFIDAGNVSRPSGVPTEYRAALDPTRLQWATGLGLRYRTPFGPVRLDIGVMVPNDLSPGVHFWHRFPSVPSVENAGVPYTRPGGDPNDPADARVVANEHREPWLAIHFSLGEAF